jgi:ABC-type uncharacterized transport system auxiliary subunit
VFSRRSRLLGLSILLASLVAGCGAPRAIKYYVIDVTPAPAVSPSSTFPISLLVGRLVTSQLYRDNRLVYGSGPVQLGTYDYDRWSEPPADMIQSALVATLRGTGQYRAVSRVSSSVRGDYVLRGHLIGLYGVDKPALVARFTLQLELYDPANHSVVWQHIYNHDQPVQGAAVPDIVVAMDQNVHAAMSEVAASLSEYFTAHPPATAAQ